MVMELVIAVLACSRIGVIHSVVFAGFSAHSLSNRILDSQCKFCITSDGGLRGPKVIHLKDVVDDAVELCKKEEFKLEKVIVLKHLGEKIKIKWNDELNVWYDDLMKDASPKCEVVWHDAEDPLFMLYTSGSTGKPKAVVHTTAGYMVWAATTFKYTFDYHEDDIYWCTADIGWITG
jgi:acetyl-CoA synthetase